MKGHHWTYASLATDLKLGGVLAWQVEEESPGPAAKQSEEAFNATQLCFQLLLLFWQNLPGN